MKNNKKTIKKYIREINLAYTYLFAFLVVGVLVALYINYLQLFTTSKEVDVLFRFMSPIFLTIVASIAYILYYRNIKIIIDEQSLANKLERYKDYYLLKLGMFSGAGLFIIIAYSLTNNMLHLILLAIVFVLFLLNIFSLKKAKIVLHLTKDEQSLLNNKDFDITPGIKKSFFQKHPWVLIILVGFLIYTIIYEIKKILAF